MPTLKELQEKRNDLAAKIRKMGDEFNANDQKWKDEEQAANWKKLNADYDEITRQMDAVRNAENVTNRINQINEGQNAPSDPRPFGRENYGAGLNGGHRIGGEGTEAVTDLHRAMAMAAWCRYQMGYDVDENQEEAANLCGLRLDRRNLNFASPATGYINGLASAFHNSHPSRVDLRNPSRFYNAPLTTQTPSTGGNITMPEEMLLALEINMLAFGGMAQVAELMVTNHGNTITWPTANDTGNTGVQVGENTNLDNAGAGGPTPVFGNVQWGDYKLSSQAILVPYELLEDTAFNLPQILGQMMGERIGRIRNSRYTNGTGTNQATGIVTASTLGVTAAATAVITTDEVYALQHSVDPAYRIGAGFMCHDSSVLHFRQKKDSNGQYIWQSGFNTGVPDTLAGSPLTVNQDMDQLATGNKTLLFGQLSKYKIRRVNGFRMYRLEERYRENDQDGFILLVREDGNLLDAGTAPVKYLQQA